MEYTEFQFMLEDCEVNPDEKINSPPVAISLGMYNDFEGNVHALPLATYGNFVFIQAPPKSYKTYFVSLLTAAYLDGDKSFVSYIKGHRGDREVLYIDTEQSKWHTQSVSKRIARMIPDKKMVDKLNVFALREYVHVDRMNFIETYLSHNQKTGVIIIDGAADLVSDVNNIEECNEVTQRIMTISSKYNCAIITVIHSNYGSEKPTGHLGSALEKKAETQIIIEKNSQSGGMLAKCRRSRNRAFDPISFIIEKGLPRIQKKIDIEF